MQLIAKILFNIIVSLATERVFRELLANGLDLIVASTTNKIDDKMAGPIIDALRGQ